MDTVSIDTLFSQNSSNFIDIEMASSSKDNKNMDKVSLNKIFKINTFLTCYNCCCFYKDRKCVCDYSECEFCCSCGHCECCLNYCECNCSCSSCSIKPFQFCNHRFDLCERIISLFKF